LDKLLRPSTRVSSSLEERFTSKPPTANTQVDPLAPETARAGHPFLGAVETRSRFSARQVDVGAQHAVPSSPGRKMERRLLGAAPLGF